MNNLELNVKGIECMGCENRIKNALLEVKEVKEVNASHETGKVDVILKNVLTEEVKRNIIETIERLDFEVEE